jgi:hypothetical protein
VRKLIGRLYQLSPAPEVADLLILLEEREWAQQAAPTVRPLTGVSQGRGILYLPDIAVLWQIAVPNGADTDTVSNENVRGDVLRVWPGSPGP